MRLSELMGAVMQAILAGVPPDAEVHVDVFDSEVELDGVYMCNYGHFHLASKVEVPKGLGKAGLN